MKSKAFKGIVLTTVLAATMLLLLSTVQVSVKAADADVEINEFLVNATGLPGVQTGQWVEIINTGTTDVDVTNWYIINTTKIIGTITSSTTLGAGDVYVFDNLPANSLAFSPTAARKVGLYDDTGTFIENVSYPTQYALDAHTQLYDGADWAGDLWDRDNLAPSKGYKNFVNPGSVKVSEVYYDNDSMTPVEFIEIYNSGPAVNIDNWNVRYKFFLFDLMGSLDAGDHAVLYGNGVNFTTYLHDSYGNAYVLNENNQSVDMMTWGTQYYYNEAGSGTPFSYYCPDVATGHSLERIPPFTDTDQDSNDFFEVDPSPCTLRYTVPGVGGAITPIDKLLMIMPWIGLASAIAIAAATTAITIKKRRP